jgi:hypothetical protein
LKSIIVLWSKSCISFFLFVTTICKVLAQKVYMNSNYSNSMFGLSQAFDVK